MFELAIRRALLPLFTRTEQVHVAAPVQIRVLGQLAVFRGEHQMPLPHSKKTRALLGYLVVTGRPQLRERLCDLLWDGPSDPRGGLRWSLSRIRPLIDEPGARRVGADHERVWFDARGARIDLLEFRQLVGDARTAELTALEAAAMLMRGELLEGLDLPGCYRYHAWCSAERDVVRTLQGRVFRALTERLADRPEDALSYARAWVAADPFAQPAHAHVIRLLDELGRVSDAIDYYENCRGMLAREIGAAPVEIEAARRRVRRRAPEAHAPDKVPFQATAKSDAAGELEDVPPLVGRHVEIAALDALVEATTAGGGSAASPLLLLIGEPGIGKTRLLQELTARVRARGGTVLSGRPFEAEMVRPYGAWIDALRPLPLARVPETLRSALSPLLPQWGDGSLADRQELFEGVVALLAKLGAEAPVTLILDDLHWLDEASAALLHFAIREHGAGSRVSFATAGRTIELEENAAVRGLVRALRRARRITELELGPLDTGSTAMLARAIAPGADARRVYADSGGNPLYTIEVARALARQGASTTDTLDRLIAERLADLPPSARELLPWAAALGRSFDLELLSRVVEVKPTELTHQIAELERHRVLQPTDPSSGAYDFTHDLIREGAYRQLSGPRRRLVHQHIARVLAPLSAAEDALAADLAHHAALAGDSTTAANACLAAGDRCLRIFARKEAAELATRGLQHAERLPTSEQLRLKAELLRLLVHTQTVRGREREIETEITRVTRAAEEAGMAATAHVGLHALAYLHWRSGDFVTAATESLRSAEAGRAADPRTAAHAFADTARCLAHLERDLEPANELLEEAAGIAARIGVEIVDIPWARGLLRKLEGEYDDAERHLTNALEIARAEQHAWAECDCLTQLAMIDLETDRPGRALERCAELRPAAQKMGEGSELPFAAALDALARYALGQAGAAAEVDAAVTELRQIDANLLLAYTLTFAAEIDLRGGRREAARAQAAGALEAAERVAGRNMTVLATAILACASLAQSQHDAASRFVDVLRYELARGGDLSSRAQNAAVAAVSTAIHTLDTTPVTPAASQIGSRMTERPVQHSG